MVDDTRIIRTNLVANAAGRAWSAVSIYLFVPIYLKMLGIESYGVIGFYAVLQGFMTIADIGLVATLNRQLALGTRSSESAEGMRDLVRTIEFIYWSLAIICGLTINFLAVPVATHWIHSSNISNDSLIQAIRLMGWAVAFQFPASLYQGGLLGLQRQVTSNLIQIFWGLIRNAGVIIVMVLLKRNLIVFFSWQLVTNFLYSLVTARFLWRYLPCANSIAKFRFDSIRKVWKYAAGMAMISILSVMFMQVDKLVVSKLLSLKEFGYYIIGGMVAQVPTLLSIPIAVAVFPKLISLAAEGDFIGLTNIYHQSCRLVTTLVIPVGLVIAFFPYPVILFWTHSAETAGHSYLIARWFIIGSLLLSFQIVPYHLALAYGHVKTNLILSIAGLLFSVPLLLTLVARFGGIGGGMSWTILNTIILFPMVHILHNKFLPGEITRWYLNDVGILVIVNIIWMVAIKIIVMNYFKFPDTFIVLSGISLVTAVLNWVIIPQMVVRKNRLILGS